MLSIRDNFLETIHGGNPDRFVKQFEYMAMLKNPIDVACADSCPRGKQVVNAWGATIRWPEELPGPFPLHDEEHVVLKDITEWKNQIRRPDPTIYSEAEWQPTVDRVNSIDRSQYFVTACVGPGIFEKLHMLMGMTNALYSLAAEPEAMFEFIDFLADWEIDCAREELKHYQPEMLFHHDDWGSQTRLFFSVDMFEEFILPAYKKVYGFWKENGVNLIVHHSDSYAAELVPAMIEMGVDVFQGAVSENNLPKLLHDYGSRISLHAGLDNGKFDVADWSKEAMRTELVKLFEEGGTKYLIPGLTMGGVGSSFPGVYEACNEILDELSPQYF